MSFSDSRGPFEVANVARRLTETARANPGGTAIIAPLPKRPGEKRQYAKMTFRELDEDSDRIAAGLKDMGVPRGARLALLVPPGIDFISLVFGLFKADVVTILIDPGMGRTNLVRCLEDVQPEGFVAIPVAHAMRTLLGRRFPKARYNVTVGRRWFWGGKTLAGFRARPWTETIAGASKADDPAAIIFTTGSTGPPKGVLYTHGVFDRQVTEIRDFYRILPGEIDVSGFPLFALFNCAMGVTTVIPDMDPTRPAEVDPANIIEAVNELGATQSFGSPAIWQRVGPYCERHGIQLHSLRRVLMAGAPAPPRVLASMKNCMPAGGEAHTPYGATEALPVASISASEVLNETAAKTREGAGTCVGRKFPCIDWRIIRITDKAIDAMSDAEELPRGEIGELVVTGEVVTREYVTRREWNALAKIVDGDRIWHRMGDVGYLDEDDRFWFCGRKSQRVQTADGVLYTEPCEAVFNAHPAVFRSALVGLGKPGQQRPVIVIEPWPLRQPSTPEEEKRLIDEMAAIAAQRPHTAAIRDFLIHPSFPVDIRHNAKIFREKLAEWAAHQLPSPDGEQPE